MRRASPARPPPDRRTGRAARSRGQPAWPPTTPSADAELARPIGFATIGTHPDSATPADGNRAQKDKTKAKAQQARRGDSAYDPVRLRGPQSIRMCHNGDGIDGQRPGSLARPQRKKKVLAGDAAAAAALCTPAPGLVTELVARTGVLFLISEERHSLSILPKKRFWDRIVLA